MWGSQPVGRRRVSAIAACVAAVVVGVPGAALADEGIAPVDVSIATQAPAAAVIAYPLPDAAMGLVADGPDTGYIALRNEGIVRYTLPDTDDASLVLDPVADGLHELRGLAIRDGVLYAIELGAFPCPEGTELCEGPTMLPDDAATGELQILEAMRARVLAFDIADDATLGEPRTLVADLPVVDALHAVNDIIVGPDGALYISVGGVVRLWMRPELVPGRTPHPEWVGTVLRLDPAGGDPEIFVDGLRNTYGLALDSEGRLWGTDNDGIAQDGWRWEEVNQLKGGHHYGYPFEGTYGPKTIRDDGPAWISHTGGTSGIVWAGAAGLGNGLLIGDCGSLTRLAPDEGRPFPRWEQQLVPESQTTLLSSVPGCITGIEPAGERQVAASVYSDQDDGWLLRVRFSDPAAP